MQVNSLFPLSQAQPVLSKPQESGLSFYTLLAIGGIGAIVIACVWNQLKERNVTPISPQNQHPDPLSPSQAVEQAALPVLQGEDPSLKKEVEEEKELKEKKEEKTDPDSEREKMRKARLLRFSSQPSTEPLKKEINPHSAQERKQVISLPILNSSHPSINLLPSNPMAVFESFEKFYQNQGKDIKGRSLLELQNMSFNDKEFCHDYIQWLFPTDQQSAYNQDAPLFTPQQYKKLSQDPVIKKNIQLSFIKMMEFYGLQYKPDNMVVQKNSNFEERAKNWLTFENHNLLRISRILRSLVLFECNQEAQAFYQFLTTLRSHPALTERTFSFWEDAANPL